MKTIALMVAATALLLVVGLIPVFSQEKGDEGKGEEPDVESMDPPGENHKLLAKYAGKWTLDMTMYQGGQPSKHSVDGEWESIMGGRFLRQRYDMKEGGMPHKGEVTLGYNNSSKKFQCAQMMSVSSMMIYYEGSYDKEKKTLTLEATYPLDFGQGPMESTTRHIYVFESDDKVKFTVMSHIEGFTKDFVKEVEGTYTRRK